MRILLTGSSGQLGAAIAAQLAAHHELIGIDLVPGRWTERVENICNRDAMFRLAKGVDAIIHTASLHQPHIKSSSEDMFIQVNCIGTLHLLEAAASAGVRRFVYTSTTSLYGHALQSRGRATWVTEELKPRPRDIYDHTKITAEHLCRHFSLHRGIATISLRVARFFPEASQTQLLYRLYRGVDVYDAAAAHVLAVTNQSVQSGVFNIAARSPFQKSDVHTLRHNPVLALQEKAPEIVRLFCRYGWPLPASIDRVYVIEQAEHYLGYRPLYNYAEFVQQYEDSTIKKWCS